MEYQIYFAGSLFDHKALAGNRLLAAAISMVSNGRFFCLLPQDLEQQETDRNSIRNKDLRALMRCDLALFNFDGPELDSGTVMEFIFAKLLDIPAVVLRTDFRQGGDQSGGGNSWNLMLSGYPRTKTLEINAMTLYQEHFEQGALKENLEAYYTSLADEVVAASEKIIKQPPLAKPCDAIDLYRWATSMVGEDFAALMATELEDLVKTKREAKLL